MEWTKEQKQVIELRNRNILVSAAAGSGKTAVLVQRIIGRITDEKSPMDVDRLLVVTFTNAAAAEMRERISDAIEKALEANPENFHLQRQQSLVHNARISTIDSFCLYVTRNYFHTIDLEPGFRIADAGELDLLKEDVLDEVLEAWYAREDEASTAFLETYATAKSDRHIRSMVLELYAVAQSNPWPGEWLQNLCDVYEKAIEDPASAEWMQYALLEYRKTMGDLCKELENARDLCLDADGPDMYLPTIEDDLAYVRMLYEKADYASVHEALSKDGGGGRLKAARNYEGSQEKQAKVKNAREQMKATIAYYANKVFATPMEGLKESIGRQRAMVGSLVELVGDFGEAYAAKKRKKNLVDFSDIEHFALDILVDPKTKEATEVAAQFRNYFEEVMVDEYQDSNYLQEAILTAVSREAEGRPNRFMVGDVKQSIYRFRLARPELFMEKYESYTKEDGDYQKIELHKNFRSRTEIVDTVNDVFAKMMQKDLGRIEYDEDAALFPGADYGEIPQSAETEIYLPELAGEQEEDRATLEARAIGSRIRQLYHRFLVKDKGSGEFRAAGYADMVVLLRSAQGSADAMAAELSRMGIPAHAVSNTGYFSTQEVQVLLNYLSILDNPRQDIPLASALTSWFGKLSKEELARIRALDMAQSFHENALSLMPQMEAREASPKEAREASPKEAQDEAGEASPKEAQDESFDANGRERAALPAETMEKLGTFAKTYRELREQSRYLPIHDLLHEIFARTGYLDYVTALPAGAQRRANIQMMVEKAIAFEGGSYRGLFHFVRYIEKLRKYDVDFGEAETISENEEAVRIMSIHKSKGLEFPICFLAGLGKQFNKADSQGKIVIHPHLGIALEEYDRKRRLKYVSFPKQVLAKQVELENLAEELRILYVAMTRAKEKLILVGAVKKVGDKLEAWESQASAEGIPYYVRSKATSYLDWILPALFSYRGKYTIGSIPQEAGEEVAEALSQGLRKEDLLERIRIADRKEVEEIDRRLSYRYPNMEEVSLKTKVSVSELKHRAMRLEPEEDGNVWFPKQKSHVPAFIEKKEENVGALRGTAVHRAMECMDFALMEERMAGQDPLPLLKERLLELLAEGKIDEGMYGLIQPEKLVGFFQTPLAKRMARAQREGNLFLEKPFVMGKEAREIYPQAKSLERVLIQGIVDVFFLENGQVHVLDYKTDRVKRPEQLVERYRTQIELYAEALARVFGAQVGERLIYSFALGQVIEL